MASPEQLTISDGVVAAMVTPGLGAGLSRFDYVARGAVEPVFKPGPPERGPLDPAMFLLLPFSNRISGGGFTFRGGFHRLEPNVPGEPYPIHGDGFSQPWRVVEADATAVRLRLESAGGAFSYAAHVRYAVGGGALTAELTIGNRGADAMPFGLGFHPWLVRTSDVVLQAPATGVWRETEDHLRAADAPVAVPPEWDFTEAKSLPPGFINNGFSGWAGEAAVVWPQRQLRLDIRASDKLSTYIVYSPSATADYFCFEPVSHPVDAHHLPSSVANGLVVLEPGETTSARVTFAVSSSPG